MQPENAAGVRHATPPDALPIDLIELSRWFYADMTDKIDPQPDFSGEVPPSVKPDLRQSANALDICRGVNRLLIGHGFSCVSELSLANGRRADVTALHPRGALVIVEIKSSVEDFRTDHKWQDYLEFCDRLYFAVKPGFPVEILPREAGLILADRYGGEIVRETPEAKLSAARRKAMTLRFARAAALRLSVALDPGLATLFTEVG